MRVLVNLLPVNQGGGLQNAVNFWRSVLTHNKTDFWLAVVSKGSILAKLDQNENCHVLEIDHSKNMCFVKLCPLVNIQL